MPSAHTVADTYLETSGGVAGSAPACAAPDGRRSSLYSRGSSALNLMLRNFTLPSGPTTYTVRRL